MRHYEIYSDLDGVCVVFMTSALEVQSYDPKTIFVSRKRTQLGELFLTISVEKDSVEFFKSKALEPEKFWGGLKPYEWFSSLYRELSSFGPVMFLIAPPEASGCLLGKYQWLQNHFGANFPEHIVPRHKDRLAHRKAVPIDTLPFNFFTYKARGGGQSCRVS